VWDVTFGDPYLLATLVVVPLVLAIVLISERRPSRHPMSFTNVALLAAVVAGRRSWWNRVPLALLLLGLAAASIAVARPRTHVTVTQHNTTVVLLVDVSGSMSSTDVAPSRISAAVAAM
jgi:Ca-activated chloride channel homolog